MLQAALRLLVAAAVLSAAGCTAGPDEEPANGVVIGISEPRQLIPTDTVDVSGVQVLNALFYPLVTIDRAGKPVPAAAASVTPDRTARVWTIRLKPGFTFSNGEPVTADNYIAAWNFGAYGLNEQRNAFAFERIDGYVGLQSRGSGRPAAHTLRGLKKINDTTFSVTLSAPFAGWASLLDGTAFYPLPASAFASPGVIANGYDKLIVGNGPFKLAEPWDRGSAIRMDRVAAFRGPVPKIDNIVWKIYRNPVDGYADLASGELDVQPEIPPGRLRPAAEDLGDRLQRSPGSAFAFLGFPVYRPEFAKPDVRRALSMSINRDEVADRSNGAETPATAFVSPVVPGYRAGACADYCSYDPAKARAAYAAAGGPPAITIAYSRDAGHQAVVDAMCRQITAALGIGCTGVGEGSLVDLLAKAEERQSAGLIRMSWTMNYPLMESYLSPIYGTSGSANVYGYSNPAFDNLVTQGAEAPTPARAIRKWQQAEDILAQDMPVIPVSFGQNVFGHSQRVTNVAIDPAQRIDLYKLEVVG